MAVFLSDVGGITGKRQRSFSARDASGTRLPVLIEALFLKEGPAGCRFAIQQE